MVAHRSAADRYRSAAVSPSSFCFSVHGEAEVGLLARLLEVVAKRGLLPARLHSDLVPEAAELTVDIQIAEVEPAIGEAMAQAMRQVVGVRQVLTAIKSAAEPLALSA